MTTLEYASRLRTRWPTETLVARAGIVLGLLAFMVTLPALSKHITWLPPTARGVWWPALIGSLAIAAGVWALSHGLRRPGWTAVGFGIVGIGMGVLTTRASEGNLNQVVVWSALIPATLIWATPLTYAAIGGMLSERSGVVSIGFLGKIFGHLNLMIWLSFLLLILAQIVLFKTPIGLRIRSVGEHPRAADTVGISVYAVRYAAVVVSGMLAALGGAYLSIGYLGSFSENMTAGRGYIALAAVIFGNWRPFGAFAAALLFGASTALSFRLAQPWGNASVLFQALPYVLTLIAVAGVIGRSVPPAAAGRPYVKQ